MDVAMFPLLVVWLEESQHWSLQTVGQGQDLMENCDLKRAYPSEHLQDRHCQYPHSHRNHFQLCRRPSNKQKDKVWPRLLWGHCFFLWFLVYMRPCVCPLSGVSVSLWNCCNKKHHWPSKPFSACSSSSCCQTLRLGSLTWGLELSFLWGNWYNSFQFVGHLSGKYGIWFSWLCPSYHLTVAFLFLGHRVSFLVCYSIFLLMVVKPLAVIFVFL